MRKINVKRPKRGEDLSVNLINLNYGEYIFLIDKIFVEYGCGAFQQVVGILMGAYCPDLLTC